jgi:hypothetical protein
MLVVQLYTPLRVLPYPSHTCVDPATCLKPSPTRAEYVADACWELFGAHVRAFTGLQSALALAGANGSH